MTRIDNKASRALSSTEHSSRAGREGGYILRMEEGLEEGVLKRLTF